ncbi:cobalt chelatase [Gammaproteobacteria bacterium]|jgi:cobaltochelatase CobT|nr:cobalt chelatase [Gammaproteobacteria bacterium]MDA7690259.1 cobalt chelatase [Gammaproteobacteria bacterium]MDB2503656.1 cobalt chelatase [Gammaproteobacteria bacterium]MDB2704368.1 cobalt chelatase [Gammaproteobacteria bacterium]MDC3411300.1 cobalt chelatase [Gammaproteobacteria bacterium]|tara:strand:+ start:3084 stop:4853 length:1770 start_codon:yes stop_codon:yes gene_type:complete
MGWVKNRDRLHEAALSSIKSISKKKEISSKNGIAQRPPLLNQASISSTPRSTKDLPSWRGETDYQSFWYLFHDEKNDLPLTLDARIVFNELEMSRTEILGSNLYMGAKTNIINYLDDRSLNIEDKRSSNFLALCSNLWLKDLAGFDLKPSSKELVAEFNKRFEAIDLDHVKDKLIANIDDQDNFSKVSLDFLKAIKLIKSVKDDDDYQDEDFIEPPGSTDDIEEEIDTSEESETTNSDISLEDINIDFEELVEEAASVSDGASIEEEIDALSYPENDYIGFNKIDYSIFTTDFDEIIEAKDLTTPDEAIRLRAQLDNLIKPHLATIGKLANRLQRLLLAKQNTNWNFNLEEGILDTARLHRVIAEPGHPLSYKQETETNFKDTVVTLLIDNSGSMRGRSISLAAICGDIIGSTLERCQIKTEVLGFTTKHWKGGESKQKWISEGSFMNPGRLNDIRHIIFKSADNSWRRARKYFGAMLKEGLLKENIDGEALTWSHDRLIKRNEERKILIVISDGAPVDDSTLSANREDYLDNHLKKIIAQIETESPVELQAIGIGHDVSKYYNNAITINRAEELGEVLLEELTKLFKN